MTSTQKFVAVYLPPGFADWEGSVLLPILAALGFQVRYVSDDGGVRMSLGGLRVQPDLSVADLASKPPDVLILIGSESWLTLPIETPILQVTRLMLEQQKPVGAICSATVALAKAGLLRGRKYTSNGQAFLEHFAPGAADPANYVSRLAVREGPLVTASGEGGIEFAREVLEMLGLMSDSRRTNWAAKCAAGELPTADLFME